ncbi:MAG: polysaccharide deacetylase [Lachnospiraceae bacterium]|nr:polysaccharide deacetylase [Lachnospiraceae bacterium]
MTGIPENRNNHRRQRINRLKRMIVSTVLALLVIPNILCIAAFIRISGLDRQITELTARLDGIAMAVSIEAQEPENDFYADNGIIETSGEVITVVQDERLSSQQSTAGTDDYETVRRVCLTFDDGPSANTDAILDILAQYGVKATFFVNGKPGYEAQYQRIVDEGHTLAMHSYSHKYQELYSDIDAFEEDFFEIQSFLMDVTGIQCKYYRFPGGSSNTVCNVNMKDCIDFLGEQDIVYFDWNVSSGDATRNYVSTSQIVNNVMMPVENNSWNTYVVLMHDAVGKETTVEALPIIIERLQAMDNLIIVPITDSVHTVQHVLPEEENVMEE